jgi:hypothetical protein
MQIKDIADLEDLRKYFIEYRESKGQRSLHRAIQNSKRLRNLIDEFCLENDLSYSAKSELILLDLKRPVCIICGEKTEFNLNKREFLECCSVKCAANNPRRNDQIAQTNKEKYGNSNFWGSKVHQENLRKSCLENHGKEYYFSTNEFKEKSEITSIEKYGTKKPIHSKEVREKLSKSLKNIDREAFEKKRKINALEKYGVDHHMKNLEIFEKQQKNSYYFKDYIMPSGKIVKVQGYENRALDELLKIHSEDEIVVSNSEIFKLLGAIEYEQDGKTHRYFPDIYIPKLNLIIEVKSTRTFSVNKKKNLLKKQAVEDKGINFQFWIYGEDLKII